MKPIRKGRHWEIRQGDSLELLRRLEPDSIDACITDPPYSSGATLARDRQRDTADKYIQTGTKKIAPSFPGDARDQRSYALWSERWMQQVHRALKPGGVFCVFTDWRQLPTVSDALQVAGLVWRGIVVWDKTRGTRPSKGYFRQQAEYVVWGTKGVKAKAPADAQALAGLFTHGPLSGGGKLHQVGKPLPLMRDLLEVAPDGALVLDPFAGPATTGVAALEAGRRFLGFELDPYYMGVATERLQQLEKGR